jgi:hypothetical protein
MIATLLALVEVHHFALLEVVRETRLTTETAVSINGPNCLAITVHSKDAFFGNDKLVSAVQVVILKSLWFTNVTRVH